MMKDKKRKIDIDLKTIIVVIIAILLVAIIFVLSNNLGDRSNDKSEVVETEEANPLLAEGQVLDETKMIESVPQITFDEFKTALEAKKITVVMLGYDACYWCSQEKEILRSYLYDNDVNIKYLDISKLSTEESDYIKNLHEDLESYGTPTFIAIKSGKVIKVSSGAKGTDGIKTMLTDMGVK